MRIPPILQCEQHSLTYGIAYLLSRNRWIGKNTFGPCSSFTTMEKIVSLAVKVFVVFPVLTLCAALHLIFWALKTATIICVVRDGLKNHLASLVFILALPILSLGISLAGQPPAILNPGLNSNLMFAALESNPVDHHLARQYLREGFNYRAPLLSKWEGDGPPPQSV